MDDIVQRKLEHLTVVLEEDVGFGNLSSGFDRVRLPHVALPECSLDEIDLGCEFLGKSFAAPLLISSMTGGPAKAETINNNLAIAAQELGIGLAVGSQRAALESDGARGGFNGSLRRHAPDIPLYGNIGAIQLTLWQDPVGRCRRAVEMIGADALYLHLNPLQEAVQPGGDRDWRGVLQAIEQICALLPVPVIAKEVGFGIGAEDARRLVDAGVSAIDVAGAGGTNWAIVEGARRPDSHAGRVAAAFREWGRPTVDCLREVNDAFPELPLIASGGIRDGVDATKALMLGARLVGQAAATLSAAMSGPEAVVDHFAVMIDQLRVAHFASGLVPTVRGTDRR